MKQENAPTLKEMFPGKPLPIFDTHCHLLEEAFDEDREDLISRLKDASVVHVLEAGCAMEDIPRVTDLCEKHPGFIYGAVGIHPHRADSFSEAVLPELYRALLHPSIRAVGEIGLDYYYDFSPREDQKKCFDAQLSLAGSLGKPVVIHDRDAHGDCMDLLRAHRSSLSGVMHCFSGSYETARDCLDLGLYIGVGGSVTFKNAKKFQDILPRIPLERILLETDSPYLTPVPFRGKRNDPGYIRLVIREISRIRPESEEVIAETCLENGRTLFGISSDR